MDPDSTLMLRVKKGDREAFAILVDKYKQPVINLLTRMVKDPVEAEDLAQSTFIQAFKYANKFNVTAKFSTWLFTIARNLALNELRRRARHPADSMDSKIEDEEGSIIAQYEDKKTEHPTTSIIRNELYEKVEEALSQLPEAQRTAIILFQQEELSYEEIAKILGCSVGATKSLIHRGRETLKHILKPYLQTGEWEPKHGSKNPNPKRNF